MQAPSPSCRWPPISWQCQALSANEDARQDSVDSYRVCAQIFCRMFQEDTQTDVTVSQWLHALSYASFDCKHGQKVYGMLDIHRASALRDVWASKRSCLKE